VHYALHEIHTRHWQALAAQSGVPDAFDRMVALVLQVPDALERVGDELPPKFPRAVFTAIRRGMLAQAEKFVAELS
jgi:serine/threonine-protein kinase HipA